MKSYEQIAKRIAAKAGLSKDMRVLEVGSDGGGALALELSKYAGEVTGTNIVGKEKTLAPNCRVVIDDIRASRFETGEFDAIVSFAAFEHIQSFDKALEEMFRLLKPGGCLHSSFGPIWSCAWGHHLFLRIEDRVVNFVNTPLPAYCHLLMDERSLKAHLSTKGFEPGAAAAVVEFVFNSPHQNRLMYDDYERLFAASKFSVTEWSSVENEQLKPLYGGTPSDETLQNLRRKYPQNTEFTTSALRVVARARG
jgi:ubiquinone/menaquinone biosynthesis C-methylase UbiE